MDKISSQKGYSLIELVIVLIIIGIISGVAMKSLKSTTDVTRTEETKSELRKLAFAVAGDPNLISGGVRADYGYVGDVGAMPPDMDALVTNPGSYSTWDGPYIRDELSSGGADVYFKIDAWGTTYSYSAGNTITSTGGSTTIARMIANSVSDLLYNQVSVVVTDLGNSPPGSTYKDSVTVLLNYPNGAGGIATSSKSPAADGYVVFDSIPIGIHTLRTVYIPDNDTLRRKVNINPGSNSYSEVTLTGNHWTGGS